MGTVNFTKSLNKYAANDKIMKQLKYMPYFLIFDFALLTSLLRMYLMPEWGIWHLPLFLYQCLLFTGFWHLIKFINKKLNNYYPFERSPMVRISLQIIISLLIISPLVIVSLVLVNSHGHHFINEQIGEMATNKAFQGVMMMIVLVVIFMFNFAFYTFHFFEHWQKTINEKATLEVQAADLEREKSQVMYHQLKNQVNPHYLFNTLTSLEALIHSDPDLASEFVQHMAKVYRYVLRHKESEVVNLYEEVDFIEHYIRLLKIRYAEGLNVEMNLSDDALEKGIVMVTLQMLIDNAIKHNSVQSQKPLLVTITDDDGYIVVRNNKQERKQIQTSNGTGLQQLRDLYGYLTDDQIYIEDEDGQYTIKLPLL